MNKIFPKKIGSGSHLRIISPSRSLSMLSEELIDFAHKKLLELGFKISYGKHVKEINEFNSSSVESRVEDLHDAFQDNSVDGILTVIGGYNSNQLLKYIDWDIIKKNPKFFCGYSDITALNNSIFAKTGLVTYSGPHFSSFGQKKYMSYTEENFLKILNSKSDLKIKYESSKNWSDDLWWQNQDDRYLIQNNGYLVINPGEAEGTIIGGNLCTLNLLQGTEYIPSLSSSILFIEDDELTFPAEFDRNLQSLIHLPEFDQVRALVIGRFQKASKINEKILKEIIRTKKELTSIPIIANVDFGHTDPKITIPIGGNITVKAKESEVQLILTNH